MGRGEAGVFASGSSLLPGGSTRLPPGGWAVDWVTCQKTTRTATIRPAATVSSRSLRCMDACLQKNDRASDDRDHNTAAGCAEGRICNKGATRDVLLVGRLSRAVRRARTALESRPTSKRLVALAQRRNKGRVF